MASNYIDFRLKVVSFRFAGATACIIKEKPQRSSEAVPNSYLWRSLNWGCSERTDLLVSGVVAAGGVVVAIVMMMVARVAVLTLGGGGWSHPGQSELQVGVHVRAQLGLRPVLGVVEDALQVDVHVLRVKDWFSSGSSKLFLAHLHRRLPQLEVSVGHG